MEDSTEQPLTTDASADQATEPADKPSVLQRLRAKLDAERAVYEVMEHVPVFTSEEAATVRGTSLSSGAKALLCKLDERFVMFVMPANRKLASKSVRAAKLGKSLRFLTRDEVLTLTGLTPGSIPPFGSLFGVATYCDAALASEREINFNAGDHSVSIRVAFEEYRRVEQPTVVLVAE